jgi:hypothetical protein
VAKAQLAQDCGAGVATACSTVNSLNNATNAGGAANSFTFGASPPTPAPTASNAPPPPPTQIQQVVTLGHLDLATFNQPAVKAVYEVAYALTLGIYDHTTSPPAYKTGCSVTSTASATRRAGVAVTYTATVEHTHASNAETQSNALETNQAAFVSHVATAKTAVVAAATAAGDTSLAAAINAGSFPANPTAADISAQTPTVTVVAPPPPSGDDFPLAIVIGGAAAAVVVLGLVIGGFFYYNAKPAAPLGVDEQGDPKKQVDNTPGVAAVPDTRMCGGAGGECWPEKDTEKALV